VDPNLGAHLLVDGKFLALNLIVSEGLTVCGRQMLSADFSAIDDYMHRCNLGPWRQSHVVELRKQITAAKTPKQRKAASKQLELFITSAKREMGKLSRIQANRLSYLSEKVPVDSNHPLKTPQKVKALKPIKGSSPSALGGCLNDVASDSTQTGTDSSEE